MIPIKFHLNKHGLQPLAATSDDDAQYHFKILANFDPLWGKPHYVEILFINS